jgi:hypothetical protein
VKAGRRSGRKDQDRMAARHRRTRHGRRSRRLLISTTTFRSEVYPARVDTRAGPPSAGTPSAERTRDPSAALAVVSRPTWLSCPSPPRAGCGARRRLEIRVPPTPAGRLERTRAPIGTRRRAARGSDRFGCGESPTPPRVASSVEHAHRPSGTRRRKVGARDREIRSAQSSSVRATRDPIPAERSSAPPNPFPDSAPPVGV